MLFEVPSFTDPNKTYVVRKTDDGYRCDCPHFIFREKQIHKCDHIRKLQHLKLKRSKNV